MLIVFVTLCWFLKNLGTAFFSSRLKLVRDASHDSVRGTAHTAVRTGHNNQSWSDDQTDSFSKLPQSRVQNHLRSAFDGIRFWVATDSRIIWYDSYQFARSNEIVHEFSWISSSGQFQTWVRSGQVWPLQFENDSAIDWRIEFTLGWQCRRYTPLNSIRKSILDFGSRNLSWYFFWMVH